MSKYNEVDLDELEDAEICNNCEHCQYLGEGDHWCDETDEIVLDAWEPTDKFMCCGGKHFKRSE